MKTKNNLRKRHIVTNNGLELTVLGERSLSSEEIRRAIELKSREIPDEDKAYNFLPKSVRDRVERNIPIAFANHKAFYPDFLLPEEKVLIEIDDWRHNYSPRKDQDEHRDKVFEEYGYITIRIKVKQFKGYNGETKFKMLIAHEFNKISGPWLDKKLFKLKSELCSA